MSRHTVVPRSAHRRLVIALALALAMLAPFALDIGGAAASTATMTATERSWSTAALAMMNAERKAHHLPALTLRSPLLTSSRRHDVKMAYYNRMSHQLPGEAPYYDRIQTAGYDWSWAGENIAWDSDISLSGVKALQLLMYNETAPNNHHRLNILSSHFANVGIDIYIDTAHHKLWMTEDFGHL